MTVSDIRRRYLDFFRERGHAVIPSASLVPENDPTTLFTGSGMQPLLPYLLGRPHPKGKRLANSQKCFRSMDIEEVGDNRHTTFFEMLGNWSLGDYFKKEQLPWAWEFFTKEIGIPAERLWVTCFAGDEKLNLPKDEESAEIWKKIGVPESRIRFYGSEKNWWSRAGAPENMPAGEPGGPDSEVFYDFGIPHDPKFGKECHPNCDCGRFLEIGNSVFMEYVKNADGTFAKLPQRNVDFGAGLERVAAAACGEPDVFTVNHGSAIELLERETGTRYADRAVEYRVIADHIKAAVFLVADGVVPSNKDQGYFVRRLVRRSKLYANRLRPGFALETLVPGIAAAYADHYPELRAKEGEIGEVLAQEENKFSLTLERGLRELEKGTDAFTLFATYGFPLELAKEVAAEKGIPVDEGAFERAMEEHRNLSRVGAEQKFKGGLADAGTETTKLHTATHLMLAGLRKDVGEHVHQAGSNITAERTRFDFTHPEKVPREVLDRVEAYVNEAVAKGCDVLVERMPKERAKAGGVEGSFWEKYPDTVDVYTVKCADGSVYSRELCGGPHVANTRTIGEGGKRFAIVKEEAVAAGIRRVKGVLV